MSIPDYLQPYIVQQDPSLYTQIDHAGWRFILRIARGFFQEFAHPKYLSGLAETGISPERIPLIGEIDARLEKFGWRAVAVSGFIPPAVFMEFLSLGILPIACDMRTLEHLSYTPAPDIVHEAAGHAPIIADPQYASYLRTYGELARRVIFSSKDMDVYEAVRILSDVKEDPHSTPAEIAAAEKRLDTVNAAVDFVSEATQLSRMGWWTIEYGLVGPIENPKIYGAGLLSSVGESYNCLKPAIRRIPFTPECVNMAFDITRPQPQLYVARDFQQLTEGLEALAKNMAFRLGGKVGLERAKQAATVTTVELDSGLQISGKLVDFSLASDSSPCFFRMEGPTQLAFQDFELEGQGASHHASGYSTPLGNLRGSGQDAAALTVSDLAGLGFTDGKPGRMEFESGIVLEGRLTGRTERNGKCLVLTFDSCSVRQGERVLYDPAWGGFDLGCGARVVSVFGGAADRGRYLKAIGGFQQEPGKPKTNLTAKNRPLDALYGKVRAAREASGPELARLLIEIEANLETGFPDDWLLRYELLELNFIQKLMAPWEARVRSRLDTISRSDQSTADVIRRGLALLV